MMFVLPPANMYSCDLSELRECAVTHSRKTAAREYPFIHEHRCVACAATRFLGLDAMTLYGTRAGFHFHAGRAPMLMRVGRNRLVALGSPFGHLRLDLCAAVAALHTRMHIPAHTAAQVAQHAHRKAQSRNAVGTACEEANACE